MIFVFCFGLTLWTGVAVAQTQGDVRLTGQGASSSQGRVEIYINGEWGTVCDDSFDSNDASVVCRQLGLSRDFAQVVTNTFGPGTGTIWLDDVDCTGTETRLDQCPMKALGTSDCVHSEDVAVKCEVSAGSPATPAVPTTTKSPIVEQDSNCTAPDSNIRLKGPANKPGTGVVQIRNANGQWGGVCDNDWDINDARVVCRSLCYNPAKALPGSIRFDTSNITEPMTIDSVNCVGTEASIVDCPKTAWVSAGGACQQSEKATVTCEEMDNSAPARPDPIVTCTNGLISASFSRITDPNLEEKHVSINMTYSGTCGMVKENTTDFITIRVPFDECGTNATTNGTHIIYKTRIRYLPTSSVGSISHANTYIFKLQCEFPRNVDHGGKPIVPVTETITESAPGAFRVSMSFFSDPTFGNQITDFPFEIPLGEFIMSGVQLDDVDRNLKVVVYRCYATPTNNRADPLNHTLIENKCRTDDTVDFFPLNRTLSGFRFRSFKFPADSQVHIHCDTIVCRREETDPECDRSCFSQASSTAATTTPSSGRRRRSVNHDFIEVSSPTMMVYDPNNPSPISSTASNNHKESTRSPVTKVDAEQTIRPPYLTEIETVIKDNGSGAGAILSHAYIMCLVMFLLFCI